MLGLLTDEELQGSHRGLIHLERLSESTEIADQDKFDRGRNSQRELPKFETRPLTLEHLDFFFLCLTN
jgi:hypothetical protein